MCDTSDDVEKNREQAIGDLACKAKASSDGTRHFGPAGERGSVAGFTERPSKAERAKSDGRPSDSRAAAGGSVSTQLSLVSRVSFERCYESCAAVDG